MRKTIIENGVDVTAEHVERLLQQCKDASATVIKMKRDNSRCDVELLEFWSNVRDQAFKEAGQLLGIGD